MKTDLRSSSRNRVVRCAIYTRKSTDEGLDKEFNSLDAQRESAEAYIKSQVHEGWECLPTHYDDGGFTGGNMERPALRRLMADIEAGRVDCVIVYKVDRLSRSLLDFARIMETFDKHEVAFVSVTQQFNTSTSMGRLVLNVLLSFAQFEREIISERTRDKIAAARRKGKWSGGAPILGYDIAPEGAKLVVNEEEASRVRAIFRLYVDYQALLPTVMELERRGWLTKEWVTKKGHTRGGKPLGKNSLYALLTNVVYVGKVRYKEEIHEGEHPGIVDPDLWQQVQSILARNGRNGGSEVRNKHGAILKGLLRCVACDCAMTPSQTSKSQRKQYRYYVCTAAQKRGWNKCPTKSVPAGDIEWFVMQRIGAIGRDPELLQRTLESAQQENQERTTELQAELGAIHKDLTRWDDQLRRFSLEPTTYAEIIAELHERIRLGEQRSTELQTELKSLNSGAMQVTELTAEMSQFDLLWKTLNSREQARILKLLIRRIDFDGAAGRVAITFQPTGLQSLVSQLPTN